MTIDVDIDIDFYSSSLWQRKRGDESPKTARHSLADVRVGRNDILGTESSHPADKPRDRLPHPDHDDSVEDGIADAEKDVRLRDPYRVGDHHAGHVHDRCD